MRTENPGRVRVGCKVLRSIVPPIDGAELPIYPVGEWIDVPGSGACVAVSGGLESILPVGGSERVLVYFECKGPTAAKAPRGVAFFRQIRRLGEPAPERIPASLRGCVAWCAPGLSAQQRVDLAMRSTPDWRGQVAWKAPGLDGAQRFGLAMESTPYWRGRTAYHLSGLSPEQRIDLAMRSTLHRRGKVACYVEGLSPEQRFDLSMHSTAEWRAEVACRAPGLSAQQRIDLAMAAPIYLRGRVALHGQGLSSQQRIDLAMRSALCWREEVAKNVALNREAAGAFADGPPKDENKP